MSMGNGTARVASGDDASRLGRLEAEVYGAGKDPGIRGRLLAMEAKLDTLIRGRWIYAACALVSTAAILWMAFRSGG
jgi:hypothetical protein